MCSTSLFNYSLLTLFYNNVAPFHHIILFPFSFRFVSWHCYFCRFSSILWHRLQEVPYWIDLSSSICHQPAQSWEKFWFTCLERSCPEDVWPRNLRGGHDVPTRGTVWWRTPKSWGLFQRATWTRINKIILESALKLIDIAKINTVNSKVTFALFLPSTEVTTR